MESEVTVNLTAVGPDIHACFEVDHFHHTGKNTPSVICVLIYICQALLSVITMCGNLLVIISIIYFKQLHTPTNYLIVSLAVADLLIGIIVCPVTMAFPPGTCTHSAPVFCAVRASADVLLNTCSILHLSCISIDRYYAVCHPLTYRTKISHHVVAVMILVSWGFPTLTEIAALYALHNNESCNEGCMIFASIALGLSVYLPVIIMMCIFCIYLKIFIVAQRQVRSIQNTICQNRKSGATVSKMERKSTKTLAIVLGVYLLCWFPFFLSNFAGFIFLNPMLVPFHVKEILNWIKLSNSMLNPFIYAFFYSWFRSAIRMIIFGKIFQGDFTNSQLH